MNVTIIGEIIAVGVGSALTFLGHLIRAWLSGLKATVPDTTHALVKQLLTERELLLARIDRIEVHLWDCHDAMTRAGIPVPKVTK